MLTQQNPPVSRRYVVWSTLQEQPATDKGEINWSNDLSSQLARKIGLGGDQHDRMTVATILYELEKGGYISRRRDKSGRTVQAVTLVKEPPSKPGGRISIPQSPQTNGQQPPKPGDKEDIYSEVTLITPALAERWLSLNSHNRTLRNMFVERLAQAIARGEWVLNGETIKVNEKEGYLVDGQHRLWAVVISGQPVKALVAYNVPMIAQETVDTGVKRNLGDILRLRGEEDTTTLAAALVQLHMWETKHTLGLQGAFYPTAQQALRLLEKYPEIRDSVRVARRLVAQIKFPGGIAAALHWILNQIDSEDATDFFDRLTSGHNLDEGNPILALRNTIINYGQITNFDKVRISALTFKAWNFYRAGQDITRLMWKSGGAKPEPYPKPV